MRLALVALALVAFVGCAGRGARRAPPGAPVSARPAPAAAVPDSTSAEAPPAPGSPAPANSGAKPPVASPPSEPAPETPPPPVESVMSAEERRRALTRIVADTTAAGTSVRRCSGRRLLPDQESVYDTARSLLGQTRAALERDELWRAESLARKARQLAASLNCPG